MFPGLFVHRSTATYYLLGLGFGSFRGLSQVKLSAENSHCLDLPFSVVEDLPGLLYVGSGDQLSIERSGTPLQERLPRPFGLPHRPKKLIE